MDDGTHDHEDWPQKLRQALHPPTMDADVDEYGNAVEGHDYADGQYNDIAIRPANEMHVQHGYSPVQQFFDMGAAGFVHAAPSTMHYAGPGEFFRAVPSSALLGMMARSDLINQDLNLITSTRFIRTVTARTPTPTCSTTPQHCRHCKHTHKHKQRLALNRAPTHPLLYRWE
jgi:hypothetical protein